MTKSNHTCKPTGGGHFGGHLGHRSSYTIVHNQYANLGESLMKLIHILEIVINVPKRQPFLRPSLLLMCIFSDESDAPLVDTHLG